MTIIGIPWGIAAFKMVPLALTPLGQSIVSTSDLAAPRDGVRAAGRLTRAPARPSARRGESRAVDR